LIVVGLTGLARAGKDTIANYLVSEFGFYMLVFSRDAIDPVLIQKQIPITKENEALMGDELRKEFGYNILARKLLEQMQKIKSEKFVLSGVRSPEEAIFMKENYPNFKLVRIVAEKERRFDRRVIMSMSANDFYNRDKIDTEHKGMQKVIDMAENEIENNGALDELYRKADFMMKRFEVPKVIKEDLQVKQMTLFG